MRELPQCPNLEDPQQHPLYDDILIASQDRFTKVGNQWRPKAYWMTWVSSPSAIAVTHVTDYGEMTLEDDLGINEWMRNEAADMDLGTMLVLKTEDHQDIIECSECRESFTCDQDMTLHHIDPMGGSEARWEVL